MTLEQGGVEATNVDVNPIQIGCGETAVFTFTEDDPAGTYDVVEAIISGDFEEESNTCNDIDPVSLEDVDCVITNATPDTESVIVNKVCVPPDADGQFEITLLDDQGVPATADANPITIGCGETATFTGVPEGTYSAVEDPDDSQIVNDCQGLDLDVALPPPSCTIENAQDPGEGTITIVKDANGLDASFSFNVSASGGAFPCEGSFSLNDGSPLTDDEQLTGCEVGVTYTVTETTIPGGWAFVDIQCSDNGDVSYSESVNSIEITLNEDGVDVVCTFFNDPSSGTIIIEKDVNPEPDNTGFPFSDTIPNCAIGTLADDGAGGLPNTVTCTDVPAGAYTVTEANPSPYILVDIVCNDPNGGTSVANRTATISLDAGETVTCVFTNRPPTDRGSITITKDTNPETDNVFFDFDSPFGDFDLEDDQTITFTDLNADTYLIAENLPSGWRLDDISCTSGDVTYGSNSVSIHLDAAEHVTCTFTNEQISSVLPTPTRTPVIVVPPVATAAPTQIVGGGIQAPSAGDGGLLGGSDGPAWVFGVLSIVAASATGWIFLQRMVRRSRG